MEQHLPELTVHVESAAGPLQIQATSSVGYSQLQEDDTAETLIERADAALYRAKQSGRDRAIAA